MGWRSAGNVVRRGKGIAAGAYKTLKDVTPGIRKAAEAARTGYNMAKESGLIDDVAGKDRAAQIDRGAQKAMSSYDKLSTIAGKADRVAQAVSRA
jgi:hypothetical protein